MAIGESSRQDVRFAENVAVLHLLCPFPSESSSNPLPSSAGQDSGRHLSPERERCLSSGLAFLAEISDDPNHVVAVATEERPRTQGLAVIVSINRENAASAQGTLERIRGGLQGIFSVLARVEHGGSTRLEYEVLHAVIRFCGTMIQKRICSKRVRAHNPVRSRSYFGNVVKQVVDAVVVWSGQSRMTPQDYSLVKHFIGTSNNMLLVLEQLESCPERDVDKKLEELVFVASRLNRSQRLPDLLRSIPSRSLNTSLRDGFMMRTGELARYQEFSRHLYQTAKNIVLLRHAEVIAVSLDEGCYERGSCPRFFSNFGDCLARCGHGKKDTRKLCQSLDISFSEATDKITAQARKTMTESKIHAEIQIVAYYELNPTSLHPRVICSNKDACYLCNEFIRIHGVFNIPKSHGRLYPGWRLPSLPSFGSTISQMNQTLQSRIDFAYRDIVESNGRSPAHDRSERANIHFSTSMSTIPSMPSRPASIISLSQASTGRNPYTQTGARILPISNPGQSLIGIPERRSPTPVESAGSDTSTLRGVLSKHTGNTADEVNESSSYAGRENTRSEPPSPSSEERSVSTLKSVSLTGNGREGGNDDGSISSTPEDTSQYEVNQDAPATRIRGKGIATDPSSESGPSYETSPVQELVDGTNPEEQDPDVVAIVDGKGKQKAKDLSEAAAEHEADDDDPPVILTKGVVAKCRLDTNQSRPCYTAGLLTVIPEFVRGNGSSMPTGACELHVKWLTDEEVMSVTDERAKTTDVQTMKEAVDIDSGSPNCVILEHGSTMVRINIVRF
ncbi:hypothetical protein CONLIGDRAFT_709775 [Coniochaeta ligniaria NRRL 30616]|uniref:Uncharacterized protein n=1 Tax=Coniochaeta ligniaria NRRL 30616 TaxID=1408157 RepID=A0A1J7JWJ9_9PEZI|nr:hypothetical protein CONLIGDRAFT_709775 [Coniochaeta ligniaria NRRL 30616]